jgi:spermidine/putrescine transport system ATP-binding protein/putrescine transport system ATP-binding protein
MTEKLDYIRLEQISKHFGAVTAVDEVSFDIQEGEFFSLLGASGCGKTTLLRMLAGFETPSQGEIYIDGVPVSGVPPHRRPTNMVFQNYAIFPHLNVAKNIAYGLRTEKLEKAELDKRVERALEMVKLPGFGDRKSNELSGGQRQRIALARALIKQPKVLLLDEPLGALDKKLREEMQIELRQLQQSLGITFIFVTHDQEEALTLSDRIAVMSGGKVLQIASPEEIYQRPTSRKVADFIGQMNFIKASLVESHNGEAAFDTEGLGRVMVSAPESLLQANGKLVVAVRPERLSLTAQEPAGRENVVKGTIRTIAYLGDRRHYYVSVAGRDELLAVAAQELELSSGAEMSEGREVWLSWTNESLVCLSAD